MATAPETTKIAEGGSSPFTDYFRKFKADGGTASTLAAAGLAEGGAGFWQDMQRQATRLGTAKPIA
jgi:hypothetical protein